MHPKERWDTIAREVFACRECRGADSDMKRAFAEFVGAEDIPPEAADSPEQVEILFVSANPQGLASTGIPDLAAYLDPARRTFAKHPDAADRFVKQSLKILPPEQSWWSARGTPVGNTRACRCPSTTGWSNTFNWAARRCTEKYLVRELSCLQPKVVIVMGAMPRRVVSEAFGLAPVADPEVIECHVGGWAGSVLFMHHPSQGASNAYLDDVREIVKRILRGDTPTLGVERVAQPRASTRSTTTVRRDHWTDLPADVSLHSRAGRRKEDARSGTTIYVALHATGRSAGATLDEIQQGLDANGLSHHRPLRLLRWMSKSRGWGFVRDAGGKIRLVEE